MNRLQLDTAVRDAMRGDNRVDSRERASIVSTALNDGMIDVGELVIVRNSLRRAQQNLRNQEGAMYQAERDVEFARGPIEMGAALANREVVRSRLNRAENFVDAYSRLQNAFDANANPVVRLAARTANVVGDVAGGLADLFD